MLASKIRAEPLMPRPARDYAAVYVKLSDACAERLTAMAKAQKRHKSALVDEALAAFLAKLGERPTSIPVYATPSALRTRRFNVELTLAGRIAGLCDCHGFQLQDVVRAAIVEMTGAL